MCPLVNELKRRPQVQTVVCVTGQHKQMLQQVLDAFSVVPDYDLAIMQPNQTYYRCPDAHSGSPQSGKA